MNARLVSVIALALSAAVLSAEKAQATPGQPDPSVELKPRVLLMTQTTLLVTVEGSCAPWSAGDGFVDVIVEQPVPGSTSASEGEGMMSIPCDGVKRTVTLIVTGGPFVPGGASAFVDLVAGPLHAMTASDAKKVSLGK